MVIDISKNIDNYKEMVVLGLTAKQVVYSILSVAVGGGIVLLLYQKVGLTVSAYIAIPAVTPIALSGFYSYNGMGFIDLVLLHHVPRDNDESAYHELEKSVEEKKIRSLGLSNQYWCRMKIIHFSKILNFRSM